MGKIIQHLKSEWYKYVLEILVITIGILGAFLLNSWNNQVQAKKDAYSALIPLKVEIQNNIRNEMIVNSQSRHFDSLASKILSDTLTLEDYHQDSELRGVLQNYFTTAFKRTKYESFVSNKYDQYSQFEKLSEKLKVHYDPANFFSERANTIELLKTGQQEQTDKITYSFPDAYKARRDENVKRALNKFVVEDPYFKNKVNRYSGRMMWMLGLSNVTIAQGMELIDLINDLLEISDETSVGESFFVELSNADFERLEGLYQESQTSTTMRIQRRVGENVIDVIRNDSVLVGTFMPIRKTHFIGGANSISPGWEVSFDLTSQELMTRLGTRISRKMKRVE
ncbi:MAG: hypothetical protein AB8B73_06080 [Ekhidna sp.]